jgi:hypothetical protein
MYQEVALAYPGTAPAYPGTALSVPGTSQPMGIDYMSVEMMEIDQPVFTAREVPSGHVPSWISWSTVNYRRMKLKPARL